MKISFRLISSVALTLAFCQGAAAEECATNWTEFNQLKTKPAAVKTLPAVFTLDSAIRAGIILNRSGEELRLEMKVRAGFISKNENEVIKKICFTGNTVKVELSKSQYSVDILPGNSIGIKGQVLGKSDRSTYNRIMNITAPGAAGGSSSASGGT